MSEIGQDTPRHPSYQAQDFVLHSLLRGLSGLVLEKPHTGKICTSAAVQWINLK